MLNIEHTVYYMPKPQPIDMPPLVEFIKQYRMLYQSGQALFNRYQPCRNEDSNCKQGGRYCCGGCEHLSDTGCTVDALWCKLWTCHKLVQEAPLRFLNKIQKLNLKARKLCRNADGRFSMNQVIEALYPEEYEQWKTT
jgi:hypothetical protein